MPLLNYGLLTGRVINAFPQAGGNPHYLLNVSAGGRTYGVAMNAETTRVGHQSPDLQYQVIEDVSGANSAARRLIRQIRNDDTFQLHGSNPSGPTLDYVRDGILDMTKFKSLRRGAKTNPYMKLLAAASTHAIDDPTAFVAVFGTGFPDQDDRGGGFAGNPLRSSFGFTGVDNIHMNQGSFHQVGTHLTGHFAENGPDQDGALFFFFEDTVLGLFAKFASQDNETDEFGDPIHTGVVALDSVTDTIKAKIAPAGTFAHLARRRSTPRTPAPDAPALDAPPANPPSVPAPTSGTFIFADTVPDDPTRPFDPVKDDSDVRNSPFVEQFAKHGVPEPVPGPRNGVDPVMSLADVLGAARIDAIRKAGKISFHTVGDTGAPKSSKLPHEDAVADLLVKDCTGPVADRPAFFFHLGDVVYYYGEDEYYYDQFYKPYEFYPAPIFAIPGNHDGITYKQEMVSLDAFIRTFCDDQPRHAQTAGGILRTSMTQPGVYFTLEAPFVAIIGLYSNCSESYGYLDQQQKLFLYKELKRLKPHREHGNLAAVILAVHHPPLSFSPTKPSSIRMRDDLDAASKSAGLWPDVVFSGHAHVYQRMTRTITVGGKQRQIPYVVCGAGGYDANARQELNKADVAVQDLSDPEFRLHRFLATYGYALVTVSAGTRSTSAQLRVEFNSPDAGKAADAFVLDLKQHRLV